MVFGLKLQYIKKLRLTTPQLLLIYGPALTVGGYTRQFYQLRRLQGFRLWVI
jgi:hypothetical protein